MQFFGLNMSPGTLSIIIATGFLVFILLLMIVRSRYRKFGTNVFVIHFRNGKVKKAGLGGAFFLIPIIDSYTIIPTTAQKVDLEAEKVLSRENQEVVVRGFLVWRVIDPEKTFSSVEWEKISGTLKDIAESVIRTTCANMSLADILRERQNIVNAIVSELDAIVSDWGIKIETVEIREVDIVNRELLTNLQAEMFWEQWRKAGSLEQKSKQEVGLLETERETIVGIKAKERDLALAKKQIEVSKTKAEAEKVEKVIRAEAEKESKLKIAEAEAQSEYIKLAKRAEGLQELNKAITDKLIAYEMVQKLPEVVKNLKEMFKNAIFVGSSGDFSSALNSLIGTIYTAVEKWSEVFLKSKKGEAIKALVTTSNPGQDKNKNQNKQGVQ